VVGRFHERHYVSFSVYGSSDCGGDWYSFVLGIGEAVMYTASNCIISAWVPSVGRSIANGIIFAGVGFGAGLAPPIIRYSLLHYGWRASFWVSAAMGVVAGAVWYVIARDTPAEHPWVTHQEQQFIAAGLPPGRREIGGARLRWTEIASDRNVQALTLQLLCLRLCGV
jgi:ACS family glucarate transporter-like MFS transporter